MKSHLSTINGQKGNNQTDLCETTGGSPSLLKSVIHLLHPYYHQFVFFFKKNHLQMYKRCISIRSCSQTRPGIWSQSKPRISLCSLYGLSLQGRGQFLVLLNQSEQDQESLSALALDCLCQTGLTPWSVSPFTGPFCYSCFSVR